MRPATRETVLLALLTWIGTGILHRALGLPARMADGTVPLAWWWAVAVPLLAVLTVLGWRAASWGELAQRAMLVALVSWLVEYGEAVLELPGTEASNVTDAPLLFWTITPMLNFLLALGPMALAAGVRRIYARWAPA